MTITLEKTLRLLGCVLLITALAISLYLNDSTSMLLIILPLVLIDRAFLIPLLFTIPLVEGVYSTDTSSSNTETIAIAMLVPILGYDLLRKNKENIPTKLLSLFIIFIFMTIIGLIVYMQHKYISKTVASWVHLPSIPAAPKVAAKTIKLIFFIVYLKLLINYGKDYIYKALSLYRLLSPYIIITIAVYTLTFGIVSAKFGGVVHFGEAHHGDFTATLDALAVFLFIAVFERRKNYFEKIIALSAILILFFLIMQMGSRNGLICFILVTALSGFLVLKNRSGSMWFLMLFAAFFAVIIAFFAFKDSPTVNRFIYEMTIDEGGERLDYWYAGGRALEDQPFLGLGGDESASLYATYKYSPYVEPHIMHNTFLEVAVEYGFLGLLFYIIFVFTIMRWAFKTFMYALKTDDLVLATPAVCYTVSIFASLFISRVWDTTLWYYLDLIFAIGILWIYPKVKYDYIRRKIAPRDTTAVLAYAD